MHLDAVTLGLIGVGGLALALLVIDLVRRHGAAAAKPVLPATKPAAPSAALPKQSLADAVKADKAAATVKPVAYTGTAVGPPVAGTFTVTPGGDPVSLLARGLPHVTAVPAESDPAKVKADRDATAAKADANLAHAMAYADAEAAQAHAYAEADKQRAYAAAVDARGAVDRVGSPEGKGG
jgi:hypothetical protein